jgi:dienelactone hydrolase
MAMKQISRRTLARLAAGAAVGAQASAAEEKAAAYVGPLTGVGVKEGVEARGFDPLNWALELYDAAPRRLRFQSRSRKEAESWQRKLHAKLVELVGGFPRDRAPLRPATLEVRDFPGYRREKVVFDSRRGVSVLAYILIPSGARSPLPSMICVPGHGRGVDDIVGIDEQGRDRTDKSGYQHDFAIQVAEAGMVAVAIEPMGFGCRRDRATAAKGPLGRSSCNPVAGGALLLGQTMIGWRVYDVMRTIDYLETRPEFDARRIGCMGISGGGTCTVFSAAIEPRIRVALVSGYLNTFRDSAGSISHCIDNYVPGILNWAEMHDVAGLIAPRPLFIESGVKDNIFPLRASEESFRQVKRIYEVLGAPELVEQEVFDEAHSFWGKKGIPFLTRHLAA